MEKALIKKLQNEVGLTYEQARQTVGCVRDYIVENQGSPDWDTFLKNKVVGYTEKAKEVKQSVTEKVSDLKDKAINALDDLSDKTQDKINDLRSKAADFIAPDQDK